MFIEKGIFRPSLPRGNFHPFSATIDTWPPHFHPIRFHGLEDVHLDSYNSAFVYSWFKDSGKKKKKKKKRKDENSLNEQSACRISFYALDSVIRIQLPAWNHMNIHEICILNLFLFFVLFFWFFHKISD